MLRFSKPVECRRKSIDFNKFQGCFEGGDIYTHEVAVRVTSTSSNVELRGE